MIRWWQRYWWARQRAIDMRILWPTCCLQARLKRLEGGLPRDWDWLAHAKAAFAVHAFNDPAWVRHYEGELYAFIDKLEPPSR